MNTSTIFFVNVKTPPDIAILRNKSHKRVKQVRKRAEFTDSEIIAGFKTQNEIIIKYVYNTCFAQIRYMVSMNSGSVMDAEDIFQDAMVILYKKIATEGLNLTCAFNTYLYSICRNLWLQRLNRRAIQLEYQETGGIDDLLEGFEIDITNYEIEKNRLIQKHLLLMNEKDRQVLKLYLGKNSCKEIASVMGFKTGKYAKTRKYICKEKLKNSIINDPQFHRVFQNVG